MIRAHPVHLPFGLFAVQTFKIGNPANFVEPPGGSHSLVQYYKLIPTGISL